VGKGFGLRSTFKYTSRGTTVQNLIRFVVYKNLLSTGTHFVPSKCQEAGCDEAFAKHHQLRAHICASHAPPGTKPYHCEHEGCLKSFNTNQHLRAHQKTHDGVLSFLSKSLSAPIYKCFHSQALYLCPAIVSFGARKQPQILFYLVLSSISYQERSPTDMPTPIMRRQNLFESR